MREPYECVANAGILCVFLSHLTTVSGEMRLQPNIGSDRSWVWKVLADYAEGEPTAETLAIRFANAESESNNQPDKLQHPPDAGKQMRTHLKTRSKARREIMRI
jgi:hypothetical protein